MSTNTLTLTPAPEAKVTIPAGAVIPDVCGYRPGDVLPVDEIAAATLRDLSTRRTGSNRLTADAKRARDELARRKGNRAVKKAAAKAAAAAAA